jgi:hypothetical protein
MAYTKPPMDSLPFSFGVGGYTGPDFGTLPFTFGAEAERPTVSGTSYLQGAINVITEDYVKECPTYVVGYGQSIQIIKGRCTYTGFREIGGLIEGIKKQGQADLSGEIQGLAGFQSGQKDLPAYVESWYEAFLGARIIGQEAGIRDLPALLSGWQEVDLPAQLGFVRAVDLPAQMEGVGPVDLSAYLQVWPERPLPASIYGWQRKDLSAQINQISSKDLGAILRPYKWRDLTGILRAWNQGQKDLGAALGVVYFSDLPGVIQSTDTRDLIGIISLIPPKDLSARIQGWHQVDLPATLNVGDWPYDITANITASGGYKDLPAYLRVLKGSGTGNLGATITYYLTRDLGSYIYGKTYSDLSASVDTKRLLADLNASIYPKTVRMTAVISAHTMAHRDLDAFINACFYSQSVDLPAYLRVVYKSDLWATIHGKALVTQQTDLGATVGYDTFYSSIDKLQLMITLKEGSYVSEDKLPIYIRYFDQVSDLFASVTGILTSRDLNASISGGYLYPVDFNAGAREKPAGKLTYNGLIENSQIVEFKFNQIVMDYFYVNGEQQLYKHNSAAYRNFTDGIDRWLLALESFYPANALMQLKRRLHKATSVYSLTQFNSIDEAIKHAMDYVITDFYTDMPAIINASGGTKELQASLNARVHSYSNLNSQINAI